MNYLAHAFLSPPDPHILIGNLWGDLLRPKDYTQLPSGIIAGVLHHKRIDSYTDIHQSVTIMNALVRPYQGKYTPVVVDVLMDFILCKYWNEFHEEPVDIFCQRVYHEVDMHLHLIPSRLHPRILRMRENRWLESCKTRQHMQLTLQMLSKRASFDNMISSAMSAYDANELIMDQLFLTFFKDLRANLNLQSEG
jgi:acyl carrier protein phosphodiesterase